jgi:hypothetical protein
MPGGMRIIVGRLVDGQLFNSNEFISLFGMENKRGIANVEKCEHRGSDAAGDRQPASAYDFTIG